MCHFTKPQYVKRLELNSGSSKNSTFLINLSEIFPALDTLIVDYGQWKISELEGVLKSLGNIENLRTCKIKCELQISDDFDEQMVKSTMEQALEIIEEKFPVDSSEIEINAFVSESYVDYRLTKEKAKEPSLNF